MPDQASLEEYLQTVQSQLAEVDDPTAAQESVVDFINQRLDQLTESDGSLIALLRGERAFFSKSYKAALKEYMQARDLPVFQFFCYRTCAFHFSEDNHPTKALDFAEKALAICENDLPTLHLICQLYEETGRTSEADELLQRLTGDGASLSPTVQSKKSEHESTEKLQPVSLGSEEFSELTQLFEEPETAPVEIDQSLDSSLVQQETPTTNPVVSSAPILSSSDHQLNRRVQFFQQNQQQQVHSYIEDEQKHAENHEDLIQVLQGWYREESTASMFDLILPSSVFRGGGGYFIRWKGHGVAINPGPRFLHTFHQAGYRLAEIDSVLVTRSDPESYTEVRDIYELNARLNRSRQTRHLIRYYLNLQAYQALGGLLTPHYKEEKNSVHCLELFLDAPEAETVEVSEYIDLHYFPTCAQSLMPPSPYTPNNPTPRYTSLGVRLELKDPNHSAEPYILGYVSGSPWSPFLTEHLQGCDLLLLGIGHTHLEDITKAKYNVNSLGFHGASSLQEELKPAILIIGEFHGADPDLRIELTRRLIQEQRERSQHGAVLPADTRLFLQLPQGKVRCTASGTFIPAGEAKVVRAAERYGMLHYLAPQHLI